MFSMVYGQMRSLAGNVQDLDDLVQVALEQVYRSLGRFERRSRLSTWTYGICYHTWLKHQRWHRRWFRRFAFAAEGQLPEEPDRRPSASEELERFERLRRLVGALSRVSPKRRAVVTLHDLEGFSVEQVAEIVGANPLTVRSRLRDGRRRLAEQLAGDRYFGEASEAASAPLTATEVSS
jgi:RNA polymerase sigma-70 factor (ECF subfamily)